ncbi:MAG: class I SAM-dependent methyltransferase [Hyphomonadaceae bacterium]|nr:class I SAM-dependent methyltransferase [Hyphomonadaceae bacterium]
MMTDLNVWLAAYRDERSVEGWLDPKAFDFVLAMDAALGSDMPGGVLEIGVHHGRFFIALNAMVSDGSTSVALDVFDAQHLNIDQSGRGSHSRFQENLKLFDRHGGENVRALEADSTTITPEEVLACAGGRRFKVISIDGGHTAEHTISDLQLSKAVLAQEGFIVVDDILNRHWLGVIDGVTQYLRTRPSLWPLAIGHNKLVMCRMSAWARHRDSFANLCDIRKSSRLCGYEILVV